MKHLQFIWGVSAPRPSRLVPALLMLTILIGGCGPSGPRRVKVEGKVTFDGAPPPADGAVYFAPEKPAPGFKARPAFATFSKGDGAFVAGSVKTDDGLVPGTYRVTIECWKEQPGRDGTPGKSHIPEAYSPPELDVRPDADFIRYDVDIPR